MKKTSYKIVYPEAIETLAKGKEFTTLPSIQKFLQDNKKAIIKAYDCFNECAITCSWLESDTSKPKDMFNPFKLGYRQFTLEKDNSMSYNKRPLFEY